MKDSKKSGAENEIVAVISAAVACIISRPGHNLLVKSIRRIPQKSPVWNMAGRLERLNRKL